MPKKHIYHLVIDPALLELMQERALKMGMSLSDFASYIFKLCADNLESFLFYSSEFNSRYKLCNGKKHIYVTIDEEDYRKMKHMHHALNVYSMAQIFRALVTRFLAALDKFGLAKLKRLLARYGRRWHDWLRRNNGIKERPHMSSPGLLYTTDLSFGFNLLRIKRHNLRN